MANRFSKKKHTFEFEGEQFEIGRLTAETLQDALDVAVEIGAVDAIVGYAAIANEKDEKAKEEILTELLPGLLEKIKSVNISQKVNELVARAVDLDEEEAEEIPLTFTILAIQEIVKTEDAKVFYKMFQGAIDKAPTKQATATVFPAAQASPMA